MLRGATEMSLQTAATVPNEVVCPSCSRCGQATRIYGIEPSSEYGKMEVCTFVCDGCDTVEVRIAPNSSVN